MNTIIDFAWKESVIDSYWARQHGHAGGRDVI